MRWVAIGSCLLFAATLCWQRPALANATYQKCAGYGNGSCAACHTNSSSGALNGTGTYYKNLDGDGDGFGFTRECWLGTSDQYPGDVDECLYAKPCSKNATCTDSFGVKNYVCTCFDGFEGNGVVCSNIDECKQVGACKDVRSTCKDREPGYECQCPSGMVGDGKTECLATDNCLGSYYPPCSPLAKCSPGSAPSCGPCPLGYVGDGTQAYGCENIDECATNNGGCDPLVTCSDIPGFRSCGACPAGYTGDGASGCTKQEAGCAGLACADFATCNDALGAACSCNAGFTGDGAECSDLDECQDDVCGGKRCDNLPGAYLCACPAGPPAPASLLLRSAPPRAWPLWLLLAGSALAAFQLVRSQRAQRSGWRSLVVAGALAVFGALFAPACGSNPDESSDEADGGQPTSSPQPNDAGAGVPAGARSSVDAGASNAGGRDDGPVMQPAQAGEANGSPGCRHSCQCAAQQWCNPASGSCEARTLPQPVTFADVQQILAGQGCAGCHQPGGAGAVDAHGSGLPAIFSGEDDTAYASLVAGGVGCADGVHRLCVDDPASSLLVTQTLDDGRRRPSIAFKKWSDPDLQTILRWLAAGAPNGRPAITCGNGALDPGEECDAGTRPPTTCPYGKASCTLCSEVCKKVAGTGNTCGDGVLDAAHEQCDPPAASVEVGADGGAVCGEDCVYVAGDLCGAGNQKCCKDSQPECRQGLDCVSGYCEATCGGYNQPCCDFPVSANGGGHSGCQVGFACESGVCTECGQWKYDPCCPYTFGKDGCDPTPNVDGGHLLCEGGTCTSCGGLNDACCEKYPHCAPESHADCHFGLCEACGGLDERCCTQFDVDDCADAVNTVCYGVTCVACGELNENCCANETCHGNLVCSGFYGCQPP